MMDDNYYPDEKSMLQKELTQVHNEVESLQKDLKGVKEGEMFSTSIKRIVDYSLCFQETDVLVHNDEDATTVGENGTVSKFAVTQSLQPLGKRPSTLILKNTKSTTKDAQNSSSCCILL